jgi:hypothetical protein
MIDFFKSAAMIQVLNRNDRNNATYNEVPPYGYKEAKNESGEIIEYKQNTIDSIIKHFIFNENDDIYYNDVHVHTLCNIIEQRIEYLKSERINKDVNE